MQLAAIVAVALLLIASMQADAANLIAGIHIGNDYEARVRTGIEHNRKSGAVIEVVRESGPKVAGAQVEVRQISSDFLFGCAFPMWSAPPERLGKQGWESWNRCFTTLFNYATTENSAKWPCLEPQQGVYRWESLDFIAKWCREHNIKLKGHNLVWPLDDGGTPEWVYQYPPDKIGDLVRERISMVMDRHREDIRIWDVVNEPVHLHKLETAWSRDYVLLSYRWAREANPEATLVINDYANFRGAVDQFVPMVDDLLAKGAPIDVIAEQAHDSPYWYSPRDIFDTLDKMASTGLRIHLTELTYPSNDSPITGGFVTGTWNEARQAEFYRYLMTLAFSHPNVDAITLWAMWDGSSWLKGGGIVRQDWTPKPAYEVVDELINRKWKTRFEARSDTNGQVRFHGFHGNYEITVASPTGKVTRTTMHLSRGSEAHARIVL